MVEILYENVQQYIRGDLDFLAFDCVRFAWRNLPKEHNENILKWIITYKVQYMEDKKSTNNISSYKWQYIFQEILNCITIYCEHLLTTWAPHTHSHAHMLPPRHTHKHPHEITEILLLWLFLSKIFMCHPQNNRKKIKIVMWTSVIQAVFFQ